MTVLLILGVIAFVIGATFLESWVIMLIANWLLASFGCALVLTFWQVLAIMFILNIIGSFFKTTIKARK